MRDYEHDAFDIRPDPDELLARLSAGGPSGTGDGRGRLRLYLGMAPGVGKTYRMLEEGHRRVGRGTDLVVGFAECHGRPNTVRLLEGLEQVPRLIVEYRGVRLEEMDVDAVVARRPTVALVDELAHTNIPGSQHVKRWEDVATIRAAGIHVVTTLNIQHLESVADAVATITGAPVHERIPDEVLRDADEIELVDMSPHALRQRMRHGNVYPPERAGIALDRFFTEGNLTALREIALRIAAQRVEGQLEATGTAPIPLVTERVLVLVDESPGAARAVRRAAHLAAVLRGSLTALVVDSPASARLPFDRRRDAQQALDDAVDLGAEILRLDARDAATALDEAIRLRQPTHVVLAHEPAGGMARLRGEAAADRLLRAHPDVELHLVAAPRPH
jgi:two-component system, OmpR family, sensor histidine kinase KdpD